MAWRKVDRDEIVRREAARLREGSGYSAADDALRSQSFERRVGAIGEFADALPDPAWPQLLIAFGGSFLSAAVGTALLTRLQTWEEQVFAVALGVVGLVAAMTGGAVLRAHDHEKKEWFGEALIHFRVWAEFANEPGQLPKAPLDGTPKT